jgi:iron-sulfur cluster repair protein YtfE (RIC family)
MLRRDLGTVRELATRAAGGASTADVRAELNDLQSRSLLFQLRANCLGYCQIVHSHHGHEDAMLFPAVRRAAPHLGKTVDRLEADHRVVSALLDRVEELAEGLDEQPTRQDLVVALTRLSTDLLEHLAFEEKSIGPVLNSWERWPSAPGR